MDSDTEDHFLLVNENIHNWGARDSGIELQMFPIWVVWGKSQMRRVPNPCKSRNDHNIKQTSIMVLGYFGTFSIFFSVV